MKHGLKWINIAKLDKGYETCAITFLYYSKFYEINAMFSCTINTDFFLSF